MPSFRPALALLLAACFVPVHATERTAPSPLAVGKIVRANPTRSYPPSCLSHPLPTTPRGPVTTRTVALGDFNSSYSENVTVTVWRAACSGGDSAVLVRFDRPTAREGTLPAPSVPSPAVVRSGQADYPLRIVAEPNTVLSDVVGVSIIGDGTLVLERIAELPVFDFDQAFTLALDTAVGGQARRETFQVPAYAPSTHPDGARPMELNGYLTGTWFDPAHSGEGLFLEVAERANGQRYVFFAWFTYRPDGTPHWIVGNTDIANDATTVTVPALVFGNGGFAGAFGASATASAWGNVTLSFSNCDTLNLGYASSHALPGVPSGQGTRVWTRLSSINGFVCR